MLTNKPVVGKRPTQCYIVEISLRSAEMDDSHTTTYIFNKPPSRSDIVEALGCCNEYYTDYGWQKIVAKALLAMYDENDVPTDSSTSSWSRLIPGGHITCRSEDFFTVC